MEKNECWQAWKEVHSFGSGTHGDRILIKGPYALILLAKAKKASCEAYNNKTEEKKVRKYKQVKEKKVTYSLPEWEKVERRADKLKMKTGTYIRKISVDGELYYCDLEKAAPLLNGLRSICNSMNQIAKKANEINSIYAVDIEKLRTEVTSICHTLNAFLSTRQWTKV